MSLEYKTDRRVAFVPVQENITVSITYPYIVNLNEVPDLASEVTISGMSRVYSMPRQPGEFFVHRSGIIYFHAQNKGTITTVNYRGGGSRIRATDWNEMIDTVTRIETLNADLTSILFGNIDLRVIPSTLSTSASVLNASNTGAFSVLFTISLVNLSNVVYSWLSNIPVYITITSAIIDPDIEDPVFNPISGLVVITNGVATTTATFDTDAGTYKTYTSGDNYSFTFTTVDPQSLVGINLTTTVVDSIQ
jgi:hypothetical protein